MPDIKSGLGIGETVGNYQILGMAGAGGMGVVYRALDRKLERTVALKFLPNELTSNEKERERFLKEARTASSLDHPNIGVIHGVDETPDGRSCIVMAFYEGESLAQRIRRGPLPFSEAMDVAIQMAHGLTEAHRNHIVHRDIKPSNVMLTPQGVAKIVDFGLARIVTSATATQSGGATGSVGYMSPEQTRGEPVDQRTDIWSLGLILHEMLTGQNPFWRDSVSAIIFAVLNQPPRSMDGIPPVLQEIIYRALSKNPAKRYQTCEEMLADLETARSSLAAEQAAPDPAAPTRSLRPAALHKYIEEASKSSWLPEETSRRNWLGWLGGAAIAALIIGSLFMASTMRRRAAGVVNLAEARHVAVLPFQNIGNEPANAALAEGLMDSLAGKLSNLDAGKQTLWVIPTSEVRNRKITDPSAALRELGATLVVEGSIQREGEEVRLTVNLIDAKNLRQIGSATFEDRAGNLAAVQDEAVSRLARLMDINVSSEMLETTGGTTTPAAYERYLEALGEMQRYDKPGNLDRAISALKDAVETDPHFALGYAQLGEAYRLKYQLDQNPQWIAEAMANCKQAAELDDRLPAVYVTLARLHSAVGKDDLALQEFQRALALNQRDPNAMAGVAVAYERMGRIAEAEATLQKAAALHPDDWDGYDALGTFYDRHQKYAEAISKYQKAIELTPDNAQVYSNLAATYLDRGTGNDEALAEAALRKSIQLSPSYAAFANLAFLYMRQKRYAESAVASEQALKLNDKDYRVWVNLAVAYKWMNQDEKAAQVADRMIPLLEDAVRMQPKDATLQSALAISYARKKQREQALTHIQTALALAPDDPQVLERVAEAYEDLGDRSKAIKFAEQALGKGLTLDDLKTDPFLSGVLSDPNFRHEGKQLS
jgi:serine/threonine-protein kinase